jgi:hypothetical protein
MDTLVCEQQQQLRKLVKDLATRMQVTVDMMNQQVVVFTYECLADCSYGYLINNYSVKRNKMIDSIIEVEQSVETEMDALKADIEQATTYDRVVSTVALFTSQIIAGGIMVTAERDAPNAAAEELPPVLPIDLCNSSGRTFSAALTQQHTRLKFLLSDYDILVKDQQFRDLHIAFREEEVLSTAIQNAHTRLSTQSLSKCWSPLGNRFSELRTFCGGIASVMPVTLSVEADFSIINWTKGAHSKQMTDFTLESIIHCKQHYKLQKLFKN